MSVKIHIEKVTEISHARQALEDTMPDGFESKISFNVLYRLMHSPVRTQIFNILIDDCPTYIATHLVRHVHMQPFVTTKRDDRRPAGKWWMFWKKKVDRNTPVKCRLWCNAESLVTLARKRLCSKADAGTTKVVEMIVREMILVDPDLARYMVPECVASGGYCREIPCGKYKVKRYDPNHIGDMIGYRSPTGNSLPKNPSPPPQPPEKSHLAFYPVNGQEGWVGDTRVHYNCSPVRGNSLPKKRTPPPPPLEEADSIDGWVHPEKSPLAKWFCSKMGR